MAVTIIVRLTERQADALLKCQIRECSGGVAFRQTIEQQAAQLKIHQAIYNERSDYQEPA